MPAPLLDIGTGSFACESEKTLRRSCPTLSAVVAGFGVGLAVGPLSVFVINSRDTLRSNEAWPAWTHGYLLALLVTSIPAAVNARSVRGVAYRRGGLDRRPVTVLPATIHAIVALGALLREPQSFLGFQWYTLAFTAVVWSAGRIGQRVSRDLVACDCRTQCESPRPPRR